MAVKKITKRWIFNSFGIILVLVIAIVIGVSLSVKSYYYNGVRQYILSRADSVSAKLVEYSQDSSTSFL